MQLFIIIMALKIQNQIPSAKALKSHSHSYAFDCDITECLRNLNSNQTK